jgi:hypothetical protein
MADQASGFTPPRYRSATRFNLRELLLVLGIWLVSSVFLALVWIVPAVEGWQFVWIMLAIGIDAAIILFMWGIFALGLWLATKRPRRGTERVSRDALRERLLNLNTGESLFALEEVAPYHLVGRWKLDAPDYYSLFAKHGLSEVYQLDLYLKPAGPVLALETRGSVRWDASAVPPKLSYTWSYFRGVVFFEYKLEKVWVLDRDLRFRKAVDFSFNADDYKKPVVDIIVGSGWVYRPILFKPLRFSRE